MEVEVPKYLDGNGLNSVPRFGKLVDKGCICEKDTHLTVRRIHLPAQLSRLSRAVGIHSGKPSRKLGN